MDIYKHIHKSIEKGLENKLNSAYRKFSLFNPTGRVLFEYFTKRIYSFTAHNR